MSRARRRTHHLIAALADGPQADGDMADSVAFSPDGKILAAGDLNGKTYLWDVASHAKIAVLPACSPPQMFEDPGNGTSTPVPVPVATVAFSPDGKTLAVADTGGVGNFFADGKTCLWNAASRTRITAVAGHPAAYSPDGQVLALGGSGGETYLLDTARHRVTSTLAGPSASQGVAVIAFAPDGKTVAIGYGNGTTYLWNPATHARIATLTGHTARYVTCLAFSPDGKTLATCVGAGKVDLRQISS